MATSITAMKRVPAGTPTVVFTTGATESASMKFAVFGQAAQANTDIKILPSNYVIPQDRFDATNFTKTAYPAGPIDSTWSFVTGDVVGGTSYSYIMSPNGQQVRLLDSSTNFYGSVIAPYYHYRYSENQRGKCLDDYNSSTITVRSFTAGTLNKFTNPASLTQVVSKSGFSYSGRGAHSPGTATSAGITVGDRGSYSHTTNLTSGTVTNEAYTSNTNQMCWYYWSNWSGYLSQPRAFAMNGYFNVVSPISSPGWYYNHYVTDASLNAYASLNGYWNGQVSVGTFNDAYAQNTTDDTSVAGYKHNCVDFFGAWFLLFSVTSYTGAGTTSTSAALRNQALSRVYSTNSTFVNTGAPKCHPDFNTYGYLVDATFVPVILTSPDRIVYKCGAATGQTRYFSVNTSGTTADYGATMPTSGTVTASPYQYNAKTLAVNYANYNQFKFTNGISDSDGLAYYTDGTGSYNTNGQSFWCKEGKYTLIRDESLKKLDSVSTDDYWFDRQVSMSTGVRKEYTGITLAPGQSFWVTADQSVSTIVFGFKE